MIGHKEWPIKGKLKQNIKLTRGIMCGKAGLSESIHPSIIYPRHRVNRANSKRLQTSMRKIKSNRVVKDIHRSGGDSRQNVQESDHAKPKMNNSCESLQILARRSQKQLSAYLN